MNEAISISVPVVEVTLLEDRAHVIRKGKAVLPAGLCTVCIDEVAPALSDKTLNAAIGGENARVMSIRTQRINQLLPGDRPVDGRKLEEQIETLQETLRRLDARRTLLENDLKLLDGVILQTLNESAEDAAWGRQSESVWKVQFEELTAKEVALRDEVLEIQFSAEEPTRKLNDLQVLRANSQTPATSSQCGIDLQVHVETAGEYPIQIDYIVPGACWRPCHTAKLALLPKPTVVLECDGCVWQNTGEAWNNVTLFFSTQRAALGAEPPKLVSDILTVQKKQQTVVVEMREQEINMAGIGATPAKVSSELPGIDDGGLALRLKAKHKASIPSDGRPYKMNIFSVVSECEAEYVVMPELSRCVFLKTVQSNYAPHPILAGPVDLIRSAGLAGRTSVLFIAPGEKFSLNWGPESALRVSREQNQLDPESSVLSSWIGNEHRVSVQLSNLGREERIVQVTERVPVSELEKVQVVPDPGSTTNNAMPDANGFVNWTVPLKPYGRQTLKLRYTIKKRKDVVEA